MLNKEDNAKIKILNASKELFAKQSFKATTIREIANLAGVNSALIKYHFENKQGLLVEIAKEAAGAGNEVFQHIIDYEPQNLEDFKIRVHLYLDLFITGSLNYYEAIKIMKNEAYELSLIEGLNFGEEAYQGIVKFTKFLKKAQHKGIIKKDINLNYLSDHLMSLALDQVFNWKSNIHVLKFDISNSKTRKEWIEQTLNMFLFGVAQSK